VQDALLKTIGFNMFDFLFPRKRALKAQAEAIYESAFAEAMNPDLFGENGIEDSFDGRFDSLLLHLYPHFSAYKNTDLGQALYDVLFKRLQLALREQGAGDMGIQPRMRKMMKAFRGRMEAYENAAKNNSFNEWQEAIKRNVFRGKAANDVIIKYAKYAQNLGQNKKVVL
jgi:cytochrome b pre-mRNA-processing protein 3